ncbi:hydroxycarboxylic acid receptor 2-like [Brienomyrus brachyistius]|uniref:hydroxycarboxylic acid receptor 2-like n=1 Tax=Brienomyrus brachyistius TaxID=42636 RepID=UPI0020B2E38B|nr:hydroxycarboxylic acid receptor 2-like [Brienomyrus brachyistius]
MTNTTSSNCCVFGGGLFKTLSPIICIEFILGMIGNGVALWIFCFCLKPWKSSSVFLFNLALADFLLNVILPFRASYYLMGRDWIFGDTFCRISLFMLAMNRCGSILFLTAVAVDRFLRVVHPHHPLNSMSVRKTVCAACAIWALTISQTAHLIFDMHITTSGETTQCESFQICETSTFYFTWHKSIFVFSFYLPLAIILFCTIRIITQLKNRQLDKDQRIKRTLHFIIVVVVVFFLCFFPSNLTQVVIWIKVTFYPGPCEDYDVLQTVFFYTISLTYLNSTLDPIVYYFYSPTFKKICKKQLKRLWKKAEVPGEEDQTRDTGSQTLTQL